VSPAQWRAEKAAARRKQRRLERRQMFNPTRDLRQFVSILRAPILAISPTRQWYTYKGREWGKRVEMRIGPRYRCGRRALIGDAAILAYIASRAAHSFNVSLISLPSVQLELDEFFSVFGLPNDETNRAETIESLRRLHATGISLLNWGPNSVSGDFPLLEVERFRSGFHLCLSDWLVGEIEAQRFVSMPMESFGLGGLESRVFGWIKSWVGPQHNGGRAIFMREAMNRLGPIPPNFHPRQMIMEVIARNALPGYDLDIDNFDGKPAIIWRPQWDGPTDHMFELDDPDGTEITTPSQPIEIYI